jgi:hypothetical protein
LFFSGLDVNAITQTSPFLTENEGWLVLTFTLIIIENSVFSNFYKDFDYQLNGK